MISANTIESVKDRMRVVEVVGWSERLRKVGTDYVCLCPFHNDKNASLHINPVRNLWHCFGCDTGGNAIDFVMQKHNMDFENAVRYLAEKYGTPIEEDVDNRTPEQKREASKKESIYSIYTYVQKFYREQLKNNPLAMSYAKGRWNEIQIERVGIGYAPKSGLYEYAKANTLNLKLMVEIGLLGQKDDKSYYDFFRDRITIPIYDKYNRIIGYTARAIGAVLNDKTPKYLNSKNSILYQKSESIFGINVAQYQAKDEDKMYMVEGAPDVLRLHDLNFNNAIACLGANWTDGQFGMLKKLVTTLCFIPDADPIKFQASDDDTPIKVSASKLDEARFGIGTAKVIKAGKKALTLGFVVHVKEVPLKADNSKNDADSYFDNQSKFIDLPEEDFILWYARKIIDKEQTTDVNLPAMKIIAELVSYIEDRSHIKILLTELTKLIKGKDAWQTAIAKAKKQRIEEEVQDENEDADSLKKLLEFGFKRQGNRYFSVNTNSGETRDWSNFVLEPLFHIRDTPQTSLRIFKMTNVYGDTEIIELNQEDMVSLSRFNQKVESLGNFVWLAGSEQMTKLKQYLYRDTETAVMITQLGWQRKGFFAFGNGCYFNMKWYAVDSYGIVRLPTVGNFYLPAFSQIYTEDAQYYQFERGFIYSDVASFTLEEYLKLMILVFGDNAKIAFCYLLASLFHDVVKLQTKTFPLLNVFGPKGSGKSELGHCLTSFFVCGNVPPNLTTSTLPALAESVAQSANAIVHLDELRNDIDQEKREFLKGLFDGTGRSRLNMERDKKRESTRVDSGVVVTGQEMATADIALFARFVFLTFPKSQFSQAETNRFNKLLELRRQGCTHLTVQLLDFRKHFERHFAENYYNIGQQIRKDLADKLVDARLINNWTTLVAAFSALETKLKVPFQLDDLYAVALKGLMNQSEMCSQNTEIAAFWETIAFLFSEAKIFYGCEFRIERVNRINLTEYSEPYVYTEVRTVLFFRFICNYEAYAQHRTSVKESTLPRASMKYYLSVHPAYLGSMKSMAFHCIVKGEQVYEISIGKDGKERRKKKLTRDQVMCFDYDMLKKLYNINLEHIVSSTDEDLYEDISVVKNAEDDE